MGHTLYSVTGERDEGEATAENDNDDPTADVLILLNSGG